MKDMKEMLKSISIVAGIAGAIGFLATTALAQSPPFGSKADVAYAKDVWAAMVRAKLVGKDAINVRPFKGNQPHGAIQQVLDTKIRVRGRTARVIVKRNHGGPGVTVESVYDNPTKDLKAITIMFKREKGYDTEDLDWFWVKYLPNGAVDKNPEGRQLAGKVAKGMDAGCIACHKAAGGSDMETLTQK